MNERFLQHIWQFSYFNMKELATTTGDRLRILRVGDFNPNQGPDFLNARIQVNDDVLVGNIEIHISSSDWFRHSHHEDPNYRNIILHVVWQDDSPQHVLNLPTLELEHRVPLHLVEQVNNWQRRPTEIPCGNQLNTVDELCWSKWKERIVIERLHQKSIVLLEHLKKNNFHWEETLWWIISRSFGLMINADAFGRIVSSIPLSILKRHHTQVFQIEALLLGQAGLLSRDYQDEYAKLLLKEYNYLKEKYHLADSFAKVNFLRMRPPGFPTVRLAQLAMLVHIGCSSFVSMMHLDDLCSIRNLLNVTASEYWNDHYVFDERSTYHPKKPGAAMLNLVIINAIIPFVFEYGNYYGREDLVEKAIGWLNELPPEHNSQLRAFLARGIIPGNAFDTQALMQLKTHYCVKKRCLDCAIGNAILKKYSGEPIATSHEMTVLSRE